MTFFIVKVNITEKRSKCILDYIGTQIINIVCLNTEVDSLDIVTSVNAPSSDMR